jgi:UDP-N-acetylglucosamine--N-acetylmuramyl-(pentapeptide) pyrophosphoryl-undecaprenol N-acetylglucosamine transferase
MSRILFAGGGTGGHLYPALALADEFRRRDAANEVMFVGARRGVEARVLPERGVRHVLLPFEPIRRAKPWRNWRLLPSAVRSIRGLRRAFKDFAPDLVVGTGGYASGPVAGWAVIRGIPVALQEQNSFPGITTRVLAGRVRQIHLAFPEARGYLKPGSTTEVYEFGNPIVPPDRSRGRAPARNVFGLGDGLVALVMGGSQGARSINEAMLADLRGVAEGRLRARPPGFEILWATGPAHHQSIQARLGQLGLGDWVHAVAYIQDMPAALASADLAVSRAGAMALAELCAWGVPSLLVPFPHAAANHQHHNAVALADAGAAVLLEESQLSDGRLWDGVLGLAADDEQRDAIAARARERGHPDAAARIVDAMGTLLR